jgi:hypothetical protein
MEVQFFFKGPYSLCCVPMSPACAFGGKGARGDPFWFVSHLRGSKQSQDLELDEKEANGLFYDACQT